MINKNYVVDLLNSYYGLLRHSSHLFICIFFSLSKARDENFRANFAQYGLGSYFVDILVADAGRLGLREIPLFDAIITDRKYRHTLNGNYLKLTKMKTKSEKWKGHDKP